MIETTITMHQPEVIHLPLFVDRENLPWKLLGARLKVQHKVHVLFSIVKTIKARIYSYIEPYICVPIYQLVQILQRHMASWNSIKLYYSYIWLYIITVYTLNAYNTQHVTNHFPLYNNFPHVISTKL